MTALSNEELEKRFAEHDVPRHLLYPWWYRLKRRLGIRAKPPILNSLAGHVLDSWPGVLVVVIGSLVNWYLYSEFLPILPLLILIVLILPLWNWWRYQRIRKRIGLDQR